jgi:hypothetical protein
MEEFSLPCKVYSPYRGLRRQDKHCIRVYRLRLFYPVMLYLFYRRISFELLPLHYRRHPKFSRLRDSCCSDCDKSWQLNRALEGGFSIRCPRSLNRCSPRYPESRVPSPISGSCEHHFYCGLTPEGSYMKDLCSQARRC